MPVSSPTSQARAKRQRRSTVRSEAVEDLGGLRVGQPAVQPQLDDPRELGLALLEARQGLLEVERVDHRGLGAPRPRELERADREPSVPPRRLRAARPVDQQVAHQLGREAEELAAPLEGHLVGVDEAQPGLVDERRRLERRARAAALHLRLGEPVELPVDPLDELALEAAVARGEAVQDLGGQGRAGGHGSQERTAGAGSPLNPCAAAPPPARSRAGP